MSWRMVDWRVREIESVKKKISSLIQWTNFFNGRTNNLFNNFRNSFQQKTLKRDVTIYYKLFETRYIFWVKFILHDFFPLAVLISLLPVENWTKINVFYYLPPKNQLCKLHYLNCGLYFLEQSRSLMEELYSKYNFFTDSSHT